MKVSFWTVQQGNATGDDGGFFLGELFNPLLCPCPIGQGFDGVNIESVAIQKYVAQAHIECLLKKP